MCTVKLVFPIEKKSKHTDQYEHTLFSDGFLIRKKYVFINILGCTCMRFAKM